MIVVKPTKSGNGYVAMHVSEVRNGPTAEAAEAALNEHLVAGHILAVEKFRNHIITVSGDPSLKEQMGRTWCGLERNLTDGYTPDDLVNRQNIDSPLMCEGCQHKWKRMDNKYCGGSWDA